MTRLEILWILVALVIALTLWLGAQADAVTRELRSRRKTRDRFDRDCESSGGRQ